MAEKVCPVWVGYLLASPIRRLSQNPAKILAPYIRQGMKVLDIGCAMGFFSLPLARMVGLKGKVLCIDVQEKMIKNLGKRSRKVGLSDRIETRICSHNSLNIDDLCEEIDFALAFAVVHEVPDASDFFSEVYKTIKATGKFLVAEPKMHVSKKDFEEIISVAEQNGFKVIDRPNIRLSRAVVLKK